MPEPYPYSLIKCLYRLFALLAFVAIPPVSNLLHGNVHFLLAHDLDLIDLSFLLAVTSLGPILLVAVCLLVARRLGPTVFIWAYGLTIVMVTSLGCWQLIREIDTPLATRFVIALIAGCLFLWALLRSPLVADLTKNMAWAGILFPLLCLLDPQIRMVPSGLRGGDDVLGPSSKLESRPPVVLVVFDELSRSTLLGDDGRVNRHRYPHFYRFAQKATWFPNASTVVDRTAMALPAILTGRYPKDFGAPPTFTSFPNNLFSWLRNDYRMVTAEYITRLCPEGTCEEIRRREDRPERWSSTAADLKWLLLHRLYPPEWLVHLPSIQHRLRDFGRFPTPKNHAVDEFLGLVRSIDGRDGSFYFLHSRLPHVPWIYTARGARYSPGELPGLREERWSSQSWLTVQAFQRHILQTQFADHLFGRLLDRLEQKDVFNRALIIVTADHGISFRPGLSRRDLSADNYSDILAIPFFVKLPLQEEGRVNSRTVENIDVVETIADILERPLSWVADGHSVFDSRSPLRGSRRATHKGDPEYQSYPVRLLDEATILRKLSLFGSGEDPESLFRIGDRHGIVGRPLSDLQHDDSSLTVVVDESQHYNDVRLKRGLVPVWMRGRILEPVFGGPSISLAVALNGGLPGLEWVDGSRWARIPFPSRRTIPDRSSPSRVRFAARSARP